MLGFVDLFAFWVKQAAKHSKHGYALIVHKKITVLEFVHPISESHHDDSWRDQD